MLENVGARAEFKHGEGSKESRDNTTMGRNRNVGKTIPIIKVFKDFNDMGY